MNAARRGTTATPAAIPPRGVMVHEAAQDFPLRELDSLGRELWTKLSPLLRRIGKLQIDTSMIKEELRKHLGLGKFTIDGRQVFTIHPTMRFSPEKAEEVLDEDELAQCRRLMVDPDLAKEALPPARYKACQVEVGVPAVVPYTKRGH